MTFSKRFPFNGNRKMNGEIESGNYILKITKMPPYLFVDGNYLVEREKQIIKERRVSC